MRADLELLVQRLQEMEVEVITAIDLVADPQDPAWTDAYRKMTAVVAMAKAILAKEPADG